jgi:hypothetical protein
MHQMNIKANGSQQMNFLIKKVHFWPLGLLAFGFIFITLHQSDYFRAIPGNMGDARFNNIVLEHLYLWFTGKAQSLWSPGFFYPYPGTLTFSDNHFGTGIVYILMRLLGLDPETAFVGWYTIAAPLNYLCCYYALRKMGLSERGSAIGAFVFTFAFNVAARHGHAQLAYRFAVPMAMLAWQRFVKQADVAQLAITALWVTVQFYCSIYLGYFLLLLIGATFTAQLLVSHLVPEADQPLRSFLTSVKDAGSRRSMGSALAIVSCGAALSVLLFPYMHYSSLYGFHRDYSEIESMLPRPSSYLLSDASYLWGRFGKYVHGIPMRWEHQMFFGVSTCLLAAIAVIRKPNQTALVAFIALLLLIILTLDVRGHSLYSLIDQLPLANAVRAVTRIGLVMIFPVAVMAGTGFDRLMASQPHHAVKVTVAILLAAFMLVEYTAYYTESLPLKELRARYAELSVRVPSHLPGDAIVYLPITSNEPYYYSELDGVHLAQALNRNTLNGYSGNAPAGFNDSSTDPCFMVNNRLTGYVSFARLGYADYESLARRVVVIGKDTPCTKLSSLPQHTHFRGAISGTLIKGLTLKIEDVLVKNDALGANLIVENHSAESLPSVSDDGHGIYYSWRLTPLESSPGVDDHWDVRKDLTADVPSGSQRSVSTSIDPPRQEGRYRLEATLVQENTNWFHHLGMPIAQSIQIIEVTRNGSLRVVK